MNYKELRRLFMERSLVLIKPDAVEKNLIGNIISIYEKNGLKVVALKLEQATIEGAEKHYAEHKGKGFYTELINFITRSPLCAMIIEGENSISKIRDLNGATKPSEQKEGTIRKLYAKDMTENCVHASDSIESAKREIRIWFPEF